MGKGWSKGTVIPRRFPLHTFKREREDGLLGSTGTKMRINAGTALIKPVLSMAHAHVSHERLAPGASCVSSCACP